MKTYKPFTISVGENRKFDAVIDVCKGCVGARVHRDGGCYGACFSLKMARMAGVDFTQTVKGDLDKTRLRKQLANVKSSFVRIGITGDPSEDWEKTVAVAELVTEAYILPVVTTKAWLLPNAKHIKRMVDCGTVLHVSLSALDTLAKNTKRKGLLTVYKNAGGRSVMRIVSAPFRETDPKAAGQRELMSWADEHDIPILETPLRTFKTVSYWHDLDQDRMHRHVSRFTGKEDNQMTGGFVLTDNPMFQCDFCSTCVNKCNPVLKEEIFT